MRFKIVGSWLCGLALATTAEPAEASEVVFHAPASCERAEGVREEIERLIERPLSDAHDADFEVDVEEIAHGHWRAVVRTKPRDSEAKPSEREFSGTTCAEVSDAAAVAIAMAIEQREQDGPDPAAHDEAAANTEPLPAAPSPTPPRPKASPPQPKRAHFRAGVGLAGVLEVGAVPSPSPGAELDLSASIGSFRAIVLGALFAPQTKRLPDGKGGEFQLALLGALGCAERPIGPLFGRGCLGLEVGQLSAEGIGVANPRLGNALWRAARVDLGATWPLGEGFSLALRGVVSAPWSRQTFVLNGNERVFRPGSLGVRGLLGLELEI